MLVHNHAVRSSARARRQPEIDAAAASARTPANRLFWPSQVGGTREYATVAARPSARRVDQIQPREGTRLRITASSADPPDP